MPNLAAAPLLTVDAPLFSGVREPHRQDVLALGAPRTLRAGETLYAAGDPAPWFGLVVRGVLRVDVQSDRALTFTEHFATPGTLVGEQALHEDGARENTAVALVDAEVRTFEVGPFWGLVRQRPQVLQNLLQMGRRRARYVDAKRREFVFLNLHGRLAQLLFELGALFGRPTEWGLLIDVPLTHQEIAAMLGVTRETVSKSLGLFKKDGAVKNGSSRLTILDEAKLRSWVR